MPRPKRPVARLFEPPAHPAGAADFSTLIRMIARQAARDSLAETQERQEKLLVASLDLQED